MVSSCPKMDSVDNQGNMYTTKNTLYLAERYKLSHLQPALHLPNHPVTTCPTNELPVNICCTPSLNTWERLY
ncbi:hypothetical protein EXN66_Car019628 [Channa argus]|uniref:Uncharacterized protein n=1 Tax=Channa argus TaxID=215402 RepID=A0A6G1QMK2_CHAAH|nr:hypothetical protein EXN66_Car019628 [Channa argus]